MASIKSPLSELDYIISSRNEVKDIELGTLGLILYRVLIVGRWILRVLGVIFIVIAFFSPKFNDVLIGSIILISAVGLDRLYGWVILEPIEKSKMRVRD